MRRSLVVASLSAVLACTPEPPPPPPPKPPPQAFLTVPEPMILGSSIKGSLTTSGCTKVEGVDLLANGGFIANANYRGNPTEWELTGALLNRYYSQLGFAVPLTLTAKVTCDDGRNNVSQAVGVKFLPVASVLEVPGSQALPDAFVAEGGLSGTPTTFIGCVGMQVGVALARVGTDGMISAYNATLPFNCSYESVISEKSRATQTRWVLQPGVGAFAFDTGLNITAIVQGAYKQMYVTSDGDAILWKDIVPDSMLVRAQPKPATPTQVVRWEVRFPGIMNAAPAVDVGNRFVWASSWQYDQGSGIGNIVALKYNYDTGQLLNNPPPILVQQSFNTLNTPIIPNGAFNADGTLLYVPFLTVDNQGLVKSVAQGCATNATGCQGASRRWTSRIFDGVISNIVPFSGQNFLAAAGPYQVYFLSTTDGTVKNLGEQPLRPEGSLIVHGVQAGAGADFYLLNGPNVSTATTYPIEIVATDHPTSGELWRFSLGGGETPTSGNYLAVDEGGAVWLRVGAKMVKPLSNAEYRTARGPTQVP